MNIHQELFVSVQNKITSNLDPVCALMVLIILIRDYKQATRGKDVYGLPCTNHNIYN